MVRKTAKRLGIHSEASHRFERGVDVTRCEVVAKRVADLLIQCSAELELKQLPRQSEQSLDHYPQPRTLSKIALRTERLRAISGIRGLTQTQATTYLTGLGFQFLDSTEERTLFEVPSWRLDCEREIDLIEEVVRVHGYDTIPYRLPMMEIGGLRENPFIEFIEQLKNTAAGIGLNETILFPFITKAQLDVLRLPKSHPWRSTIRLKNPLVEEQCYLRTTLVASLLEKVAENRKHGRTGVRLFEVARSFFLPTALDEAVSAHQDLAFCADYGQHLPPTGKTAGRTIERNILAAVIDQPLVAKTWQNEETFGSFFAGKVMLEQVFQSFGLSGSSYSVVDQKDYPHLHPGAAASVTIAGKSVGYLGELHPAISPEVGLKGEHSPIIFELYLDELFAVVQKSRDFDTTVVKFPSVKRDLALVVDRKYCHSDLEKCFQTFNRRKNLKSFHLFDVYEGDKLATEKKSMAFNLEFRSEKKSLTDKEVEKEVTALIAWFKDQLGAELR